MQKVTVEQAIHMEWSEEEYNEYQERYLDFIRGIE